jgi:hypothetical protein
MIEHNDKERSFTIHDYPEDGAFIEIASKFDCARCNCSIMATRFMRKRFTTEEEVKALADRIKEEHLRLHELAELGKKFKSAVKDIEGLWKEKV